MTLTEEFAALLDELGLGTWAPTGLGGDLFAGPLPDQPDEATAVTLAAGQAADAHLGYDEPTLLVRARGPRGRSTAAEARAQAAYDALHGLRRRTLAGGTVMLSCHGLQSGPIPAGVDTSGRHEWSVTFTTELRRPTANRV